jgi:hypothetical protein
MRSRVQALALRDFYTPFRSTMKKASSTADLRDIVGATLGDTRITYLEFGVASGKSMREMVARFKHRHCEFYGFDSFAGLPERWNPNKKADFPIGHFSTGEKFPDINDSRVQFVKGWIQNTLPPFISTGKIGGPWPHLVHFDADLYSSTLFILATLWHNLPEYYFMMDEYPYDEIVALRDFVAAFPVEVEFFAEFTDKTFGRLRRAPFTLAAET